MIFHVMRDGEVLGEFEEAEFKQKVFANEVWPDDLYWHEGMADWKEVTGYRAPQKVVAKSPPTVRKLDAIVVGIVMVLLVFVFASYRSDHSGRALTIADRERVERQAQAEGASPLKNLVSSRLFQQLSKQAEENMRLAKEHKIRVGMIGEQVEMAWGKPEQVTRVTDQTGEGEQWIYPNGDRLYFSDGTLRYIDTTRRR